MVKGPADAGGSETRAVELTSDLPADMGKSQRSPSTTGRGSAGRESGKVASNPVFNRSHRALGGFSPKALPAALLGKEGGYN